MTNITFHPQAWQNDYAIPVDPEGPIRFQVPDEDTTGLTSDTYESDDLRFHANAPEWIKEWSGPFYIEIEEKW